MAHDGARNLVVLSKAASDENCARFAFGLRLLRAAPRLGDGHRRMNAVFPGLVVRSRNHAAAIPAFRVRPHYDRQALQARPVALLDGGEKCVHIDMQYDPHGKSPLPRRRSHVIPRNTTSTGRPKTKLLPP